MLLTVPVHITCRSPEKPKKAKPAKAELNELEERSRSVTRSLLIALAARVAFFLLPFLPLRIKNLLVVSKVRSQPPTHAAKHSQSPLEHVTDAHDFVRRLIGQAHVV